MLLHVGWHHIVFNSALTLLLGIPLELVHKAWRVAPIFLAGVLAGSLLSSVAEPAVTLLGASGGVYALIGAHYGLVIMNWEELQEGWQSWRKNPLKIFSSGLFRLLLLTLLVALDFGVALYRRYTLASLENSVSLTAHAAGLLCGILVGIPCLRNLDKKPWEMVLFWVAIGLLVVYMIFAVLWNIFYMGYPTDIPCNV
ncbi:hypothetical protein BOX15_Mlig002229g3 [Macrostomum lignano]|uniref:Peptidase S54 rhomboid domain-containing protein n=1 Tax=Macrostomum lignano TaxID=282301 RepID=A0A267DIT2_9PLAT|nr:hypothetical protein BOX15_Mlig002229g3 [Macrostomum lignano]